MAVNDAVSTLTRIGVMVLALLDEGDMHPYEMIRLMRQRRGDRLGAVTPGTLYHTVARLQKQGLLAEVGVDRNGNRPERTTYTITEAGAAAAVEWVQRELRRVDHPADFRIALAEAHNLDRHEVIALLTARREALAVEHAYHVARLHEAEELGTPPQFVVEFVRQEALLEAEQRWIDRFLAQLAQREFAWGPDELPVERSAHYLAQRKAARQ